ncbi:glycosyltransferase [Chromobacterium sp. IIBBL 290-4]|uniref:glycosyltransferase n=1 Tax=Chromobacterium sp. IIBBL 290-4 TaxID=2953890 RepID=UPI0020B7DDF8|nr:glycosyltransferase [Chromobacterium sp. IIBBL 290-4]UTH74388.1 glycosyltransferase [Chromobacterium sp. IIBBL 290-4]
MGARAEDTRHADAAGGRIGMAERRLLMRIALLAPLPPAQNGIADYADAWGEALRAAGADVAMPLRGQSLSPHALLLDKQMEKADWSEAELVHAELGEGCGNEFLALEWLARRYPYLPLTATVHDPGRLIWQPVSLPWPWSQATGLPRSLRQAAVCLSAPLLLARERRLAGQLSRLIALTTTGARCLQSKMRLPVSRVAVIPHGNAAAADAPLPPGPLKLLYFGFFHPDKGIEDLLQALALLQAARPALSEELSLTLAGGVVADAASGNLQGYPQRLRDYAARLGLAEPLLEWRLNLPAAHIPRLIQAHHVMALPYREARKWVWLERMRGASGALSWAAACGRGAICSDARVFAEELSHGNGALFPQGDYRALARVLDSLLNQPGLAERWGAQAARLGRERAWPRVAGQFLDLFDSLPKRRMP